MNKKSFAARPAKKHTGPPSPLKPVANCINFALNFTKLIGFDSIFPSEDNVKTATQLLSSGAEPASIHFETHTCFGNERVFKAAAPFLPQLAAEMRKDSQLVDASFVGHFDSGVAQLVTAAVGNGRLERIRLGDISEGMAVYQPMIDAFRDNKTLQYLNISCSNPHMTMAPILDSLRGRQSLRRLTLLFIPMGELTGLLSSLPNLDHLTLSDTQISQESQAKTLFAALGGSKASLRRLRLCRNDLDNVAEMCGSKALRFLEKLYLPCNKITAEGVRSIADRILARNRKLRRLDLSGNPVSTAGARYIVDAHSQSLVWLGLASAGLNADAGKVLAPMVAVLQKLDLSGNLLGDEGVVSLFLGPGVRHGRPMLEELGLGSVNMTERGGKAVAEWIGSEEGAKIRTLDLKENALGDRGAKAILDTIAAKSRLVRELVMDHNAIGEPTVESILGVMGKRLGAMRMLKIGDISMRRDNAKRLEAAAQKAGVELIYYRETKY